MRVLPLALALTALALVACEPETPSATVQRVPAEPAPAAASPPPAPMTQQSLPAELVNAQGAPHWNVPATWTPGTASAMRRGSFNASGADVSVTSFPGDVGGLLANINRWRGQVGLSPITEAELATTTLATASGPATWVEMSGPSDGTLAAIFMHQGNSWFFKMTGPLAAIEAEAMNFRAFVESVDFSHFH